jgi:hypothetical protein
MVSGICVFEAHSATRLRKMVQIQLCVSPMVLQCIISRCAEWFRHVSNRTLMHSLMEKEMIQREARPNEPLVRKVGKAAGRQYCMSGRDKLHVVWRGTWRLLTQDG